MRTIFNFHALTKRVTRSCTTRVEHALSISIGIQDRLSQQLSFIMNQETGNSATSQYLKSPHDSNLGSYAPTPTIEPSLNGDMEYSKNIAPETPCGPIAQSDIVPVREQAIGTCRKWCSCRCHVQRSLQTPWILNMLVGRISIHYTGQRPSCNETNCKRTSTVPAAMTYVLPRYLFRRYITLTMHYTPLDGPAFSLRAPRVTSWSHVYWNYASKGDLQAIQRMFEKQKASPFDLNPRGGNALHYAGNHKDCRISQFLISQGADTDLPNEAGRAPNELLLDRAFSCQDKHHRNNAIDNIFKNSDYLEIRAFTKLHKIILGIIQNDLSAELDVSTTSINVGDVKGRTPLAWAVVRNDLGAVKSLLSFGACPNIVDSLGIAPLGLVKGSKVCEALLEAGANVHSRDKKDQRTALHQLCLSSGNVEAVKLLVQSGINVNVQDADNETPLLNAICWNMTDVAKELLNLGADVNATNLSSGDNSMHFAVSCSSHEIIPFLLSRGVNYAALNVHSRNIAHKAAMSADTRTIQTLTEAKLTGLDLSLKDVDGKTPAERLAEREVFGDSEIGIHEAFEAFEKSTLG